MKKVGTALRAVRRARGPASALDVRRSAFVVAFLLTLTAITAIGPWLIHEVPLDDPHAILSLGSHEYERYPHTAALAKRWPGARVLITQPRELGRYNCDACPYRVEWLESLGVARDRVIMLTPPALNTREELEIAAAWMRADGLTRLLVVTSPYHTRRVGILAETVVSRLQVGISATRSAGEPAMVWWLGAYDRWYVPYEAAALVANWRHLGAAPRLPRTQGRAEFD